VVVEEEEWFRIITRRNRKLETSYELLCASLDIVDVSQSPTV